MEPARLLAPGRAEVCFPVVFAGVKQIVRANAIDDTTRSQLKNWLKQTGDAALALMSLTVRWGGASGRKLA